MDKWNEWNEWFTSRNGGGFTYESGHTFLQTCDKIEIWGCLGVDGNKTDLTKYISHVDGIYMRHVLEHNDEWKLILENACKSFLKKMCLVLCTPFSGGNGTKDIACRGNGPPDLSFDKNELEYEFEKYHIHHELITMNTETGYGIEHVFYLTKSSKC